MRASGKNPGDVGMAFVTGFIAGKTRALDQGRRRPGPLQAGTGTEEQPRR
jgi:hypothetical protein